LLDQHFASSDKLMIDGPFHHTHSMSPPPYLTTPGNKLCSVWSL